MRRQFNRANLLVSNAARIRVESDERGQFGGVGTEYDVIDDMSIIVNGRRRLSSQFMTFSVVRAHTNAGATFATAGHCGGCCGAKHLGSFTSRFAGRNPIAGQCYFIKDEATKTRFEAIRGRRKVLVQIAPSHWAGVLYTRTGRYNLPMNMLDAGKAGWIEMIGWTPNPDIMESGFFGNRTRDGLRHYYSFTYKTRAGQYWPSHIRSWDSMPDGALIILQRQQARRLDDATIGRDDFVPLLAWNNCNTGNFLTLIRKGKPA